MRLVRLRVNGFKSFADPVELAIEPGMTGVVGPNGCGKSNLLEALRWVMGETSAKRMRGDGMDDLIFGGTDSRQARNVAEVRLEIDNSDRTAPSEFNESDRIEVVRRIERGQGTSYRVNGRPARLRDVQTLFRDQGSGHGSAAMVSQGRVGALISAKPSDRRSVLEDAAGVSGLHARRHEAELRLRATEQNLLRADDAAAGMQSQLQGLRKQARQAARYKSIDGLIRQAEAVALLVRVREAHARCRTAAEAHGENEKLVGEAMLAVQSCERDRTAASAAIEPIRKSRMAAEAALARASARKESAEADLKRCDEGLREARERHAQATGDIERETQLQQEAAAALNVLADEASFLAERAEGDPARVSEAEAKAEAVAQETKSAEDGLQALMRQAAETQARRAAAERRLAAAAARIEAAEVRLDEAKAHCTATAKALEAAVDEAPKAATAAQAAAAGHAEASKAAEAAEKVLAQARECENLARTRLTEEKSGLVAMEAEARGLAASSSTSASRDPVLGRLEVDPGVEAAVAAALGDGLHAGTDPDEAAHWSGDCGSEPSCPEGFRCLGDVVTGTPEISARLSGVGLAENEEAARSGAPSLLPGQRLVTADGRLWRWDGYRSRQDRDTDADGLRRAARRREIEAALPAQRGRVRDAEDTLAAAAESLSKARGGEEAARAAARAAYAEAQAREADREAAARSLSAAEQDSEAATGRLHERTADRDAVVAELTAAREEIESCPAADSSAVDAARERLSDLRAREAEGREALSAARGEASARAQRRQEIERERDGWQSRSEGAGQRIEELSIRVAEAAAVAERMASAPERLASLAAEAAAAAEEARKSAEEEVARLLEAEAERDECDAVLRAAESSLGSLREQRARLAAEMDAAQESAASVQASVQERLGIEDGNAEALKEIAGVEDETSLPSVKSCEDRLARLQREKESLGAVNLLAEESAAELEAKLQAAAQERDELRRAVDKLRRSIADINREALARLDDAFARVDGHFRDVFTRLFGGGHAYLKLTGTDDPLEAGLEIYASPPGKRLQSLSLLSGGEQALTALSLVFAAFLTSPSPVCVLDEVDAPLDDANVDRLCGLMEELSKGDFTRFLVITHHAMTMARVDRLYGVTMAEKGVSQIATVTLDRAVEIADA